MDNKHELSAELRTALEKWAEDNLKAMGIFKDQIADFEEWREKFIKQVRSVYSDKTIELFLKTKDNRKIDSPDGFAKVTDADGHAMEIFLKVNKGKITDSSFQTNGCRAFIASGGIVAEMIKGKSLDRISTLTSQDIMDALGGLPKENEHCALLAINTLKEALKKLSEGEKAGK
jgi:nitrogen fixation protein NifU and related proteins